MLQVTELNFSITGKHFLTRTPCGTNGFDSAELALGDALRYLATCD